MDLGLVQRLGAEMVTEKNEPAGGVDNPAIELHLPVALPIYWGEGLRIGGITASYFALVILIDRWCAPIFTISFLSWPIAIAIASIMCVVGLFLYVATTLQLRSARKLRRLMTDGPYRLVRHPLYAIGLWLLCPGVCFLSRSYLVLTTPIVMALAMHYLIPKEERKLVAYYGDAYRAYQRKVPMLWPLRRPR